MTVVQTIANLEMYYNDYLFACKTLALDPRKLYDQEVINQKVDAAVANLQLEKKEQKKLNWFKKDYKNMEGGVFGYKLVTRAQKEIESGKLVLDYEIQE